MRWKSWAHSSERWPALAKLLGGFSLMARSLLVVAGLGFLAEPDFMVGRTMAGLMFPLVGVLTYGEGRQWWRQAGVGRARWEQLGGKGLRP